MYFMFCEIMRNHRAFLKKVFANLSGTVDLSIILLNNAGGGGYRFTKALPSLQHFVYCRAVFSSLVNRLPPPPALLRSIMERSTVPLRLAKTFFKNARWFNTSASFASCKRLLIERFLILFFFRKVRSSSPNYYQ